MKFINYMLLAGISLMFCTVNAAEIVSNPEKDRPLITVRLSLGETDPHTWGKLYGIFERNPKLCDEVWFSVTGDFSIDLPETHHVRSANMAKAAADLRKIGIIPSLHFERTIGYGAGSKEDNPAYNWGNFVGQNGTEVAFVSCPRQEKFHKYLYETSKIYAVWKPGSVWLDDDVQLELHNPVHADGGCHCQYCIDEFSKAENKKYTRESLVEAYKKDKALYDRWYEFQYQSIEMMTSALICGFRELSPNTRFGLQHCSHKSIPGIVNAFKRAANCRIGIRPGGGAWFDHDPYMLVNKAIKIFAQVTPAFGYETVGRVSPEIEDCPRGFASKTRRGRRLESIMYLALGGDSLTYLIHGPGIETIEWYEKNTFAPLAKETDDYRAYARCNEGTVAAGAGIAKGIVKMWDLGLPMVGVPFAAHSRGANFKMLKKEMIDTMDDAELSKVLAGNLILDGAAAAEVKRRGFGNMIGGLTTIPAPKKTREYFSDDLLNKGIAYHGYSTTSTLRYAFKLPEKSKFRVLSVYATAPEDVRERFDNYTLEDKKVLGIGTVILERADGTRLAFIGYDGMQTLQANTARVTFLNRIADWVAHEKLPVLADEPVKSLIIPRVDAKGVLKTVAIINQSIDHSLPFTLKMRNIPAGTKTVKLHRPGKTAVTLPVSYKGNFACVEISEMEGWDAVWLEI